MQEWLVDNEVVNLNGLTIDEEFWVWKMYIDLVCLSFDGDLTDICLIAAQCALKNLKIPNASNEKILFFPNQIIFDDLSPKSKVFLPHHTLGRESHRFLIFLKN